MFRKLKFITEFTFLFVKKFKFLLLIGVVSGVLLSIVGERLFLMFLSRTTERIGVTGRFQPEELPEEILKLIGSGLTYLDASGIPNPDIASSWETPDKGLTWIFKLKKDILWQDGSELDSYSISYNLPDVKIEKPDPQTIIFKLKEPYSSFPVLVSKPLFKKGLLGTGAWKVKKISISSNQIVRELILSDKNNNRKIFKFYPTLERTKLALKLGEIDIINNIHDPSPFETWNNLSVLRSENPTQIVAIFFNNQDKLLSEKSLRQALAYSIANETVEKKLISPLPPNSWAYNPQIKHYDYDLQKASQLIDSLPKEIKENLTLKLDTSPILLNLAEKIARDWNKINVKTQVQVSPTIPTEFQAFLTIIDVPLDPDQYSIWHSTRKETNISRYSNQRIDKLLEDGRIEVNLEARKKIYLDFQRFIAEDLPSIFLYNQPNYSIKRI